MCDSTTAASVEESGCGGEWRSAQFYIVRRPLLSSSIEFKACESRGPGWFRFESGRGGTFETPSLGKYTNERKEAFDLDYKPPAVRRFPNFFGNTLANNSLHQCYINAVFQALSHLAPLQQIALNGLHNLSCSMANKEDCGACAFYDYLTAMWQPAANGRPQTLSTTFPPNSAHLTAWKKAHITPYADGCAHEFLIFLLGWVRDYETALKPSIEFPNAYQYTTLTGQALGFILEDQMTCQGCSHQTNTYRFENHLLVSSDSPEEDQRSLTRSLAAYFQPLTIQDFRCEKCKLLQEYERKSRFLVPPNVLIITIHRAALNDGRGRPHKLEGKIAVEEKIDIGKYLIGSHSTGFEDLKNEYRLTSAIRHLGSRTESGHYVTLYFPPKGSSSPCKKFDDEYITDVQDAQSEKALLQGAYVFFYTREGKEVPSPLFHQQAAAKSPSEIHNVPVHAFSALLWPARHPQTINATPSLY